MIADFNKRTGVAISELGIWNVQAQYDEALRGSLVERVFSFLEQYPFSDANGEDVALPRVPSNPAVIVDESKSEFACRPSKSHSA